MNSFIVVRNEHNVNKTITQRAEETPHLLEREQVHINLESESFYDKEKALETIRHYPLETNQLLVASVVERFYFLPEFYVTGSINMTEGQAKAQAYRQHQPSQWTRFQAEQVSVNQSESVWRMYQAQGAMLLYILAWAS